jgi:hypothetical protein
MTYLLHHQRSGTSSTITVAKEEKALISDFEILVCGYALDNFSAN